MRLVLSLSCCYSQEERFCAPPNDHFQIAHWDALESSFINGLEPANRLFRFWTDQAAYLTMKAAELSWFSLQGKFGLQC